MPSAGIDKQFTGIGDLRVVRRRRHTCVNPTLTLVGELRLSAAIYTAKLGVVFLLETVPTVPFSTPPGDHVPEEAEIRAAKNSVRPMSCGIDIMAGPQLPAPNPANTNDVHDIANVSHRAAHCQHGGRRRTAVLGTASWRGTKALRRPGGVWQLGKGECLRGHNGFSNTDRIRPPGDSPFDRSDAFAHGFCRDQRTGWIEVASCLSYR